MNNNPTTPCDMFLPELAPEEHKSEAIKSFSDLYIPPPTSVMRNVEAYYLMARRRIEKVTNGMIELYSHPDYKLLRDFVHGQVGKVMAEEIFNRNL